VGEDGDRAPPADDSLTEVAPGRVATAVALLEAAPLVPGMLLAGRYKVEKLIGRGGMGLVVRAFDRTLGTAVAIKILRAEYAGERQWAERLAREVRLARQIHHPNVCRVFDFEQADGRVFLVMELATEATLRTEIALGAVKARPLGDRLADARAIASGLAAIHAAGIIHRDVSPQNVLRMLDGRLVLSDFGLAIDSFESTTSIRGGTIAYMAPEVVSGTSVSFAADVWSLGAVMHEAVFGDRPRWRDASRTEITDPAVGRRLMEAERVVLEVCRACTAAEPAKRPGRAAAVVPLLSARRAAWTKMLGTRRRRIAATAVACTAVAMAVGSTMLRRRRATGAPTTADASLALKATGEPEDWTEKSQVLAELSGPFECMVSLPDRQTIRLVWGKPRRAEDLDVSSGRRTPSPVVPEAYAEGCPDLSPDGKRLVFQGRGPEDRPYAFVSNSSDGRDAKPVVPIGDPSLNSHPIWLAGGESFLYDVDLKYVGVFSTTLNRTTVLAPPSIVAHPSVWHWGSRDWAIISAFDSGVNKTEVVGYRWPSLTEAYRVQVGSVGLDFRARGSDRVLFTAGLGNSVEVLEVDHRLRMVRRLGFVRDQFIRGLHILEHGLVFVSVDEVQTLEARDTGGTFRRVLRSRMVFEGERCGDGLVTSERTADKGVVSRRDSGGRTIAITDGPEDFGATCSSTGEVMYYAARQPQGRIVRCSDSGCATIAFREALSLSSSPDGQRVAFVESANRGLVLRWAWARDGVAHDVTAIESMCPPTWSSNRTLWIVRQRHNQSVWIEIEVDSGRETGRTEPTEATCVDGRSSYPTAVERDTRVVSTRVSQVRLIPESELPIW